MFLTTRSLLARVPVLAGLELAAMLLSSSQRGLPPIAPVWPPVQAVALAKTIDMSNDEEEVNWDSLEKEIDVEEKAEVEKEVAKEKKKKVEEEGKGATSELVLSSSLSSSDLGNNYSIGLRSGRLQIKRISRDMRCRL